MKIQLFTSLSGLKNRIEGKHSYAFTEESAFRNEIDNIVILVNDTEIIQIDADGIIQLKPLEP